MYNAITQTIELGDGRIIEIETGKLAKQADGSVTVKCGGTVLLATAVSATEAKPDVDFMPLSVEYKEKFAAAGRFPGGFLKREARPSDYEILVARLVDRALRPLFPEDYHADTFVTVQLMSVDESNMPDSLAGLAAAAALAVSDIPFNGPISEVRVARVDGGFKINPTPLECDASDIDIIVAATSDNILMVEGEMNEVSEAEMLEAIKIAHEEIKKHCSALNELAKAAGKEVKREYCHEENDEDLREAITKACYDKVYEVAGKALSKKERSASFSEIKNAFIESLPEDPEPNMSLVGRYFHDVEKKAVRDFILDTKSRIDGRQTTEIRPIWCEIDCLPSPHGSAIFTRGETQSLTTVTLGTKLDEKTIDEVTRQGKERLLLHYNFPPFSTNDARPARGLSRREIGHGNLAFRALRRMVPCDESNPYTIRIVSEILESNGSSSMATVCAGTLALMDAGVNIKKPVTGIAMGLITESGSDRHAVLSDILGDEDHLGDMDFKVCGTVDGITACQMDIKVDGLSYEILSQALEQARQGRLHIMEKVLETIPETRNDYKDHAPRIERIDIPKEFIGQIIGPGGKNIQELQARTNTIITIEEVGEVGQVELFGQDKEGISEAKTFIQNVIRKPEVGEVFEGTVKNITDFGAFIEILPGKEGLLHISEIEWRRLKTVDEVLKSGDLVTVKLIGIEQGKLRLSRKVLLPRPPKQPKQ